MLVMLYLPVAMWSPHLRKRELVALFVVYLGDRNLSRRMIKPTKLHVRPAKTQINLGIRPVWSESLLCAQWVTKDPIFLHADSEDSDQTGRMPRLIWVFAGHTVILLVLLWGGSICVFSFFCSSSWCDSDTLEDMSHVTRKPVLGVCDQVRLKPPCFPTETS